MRRLANQSRDDVYSSKRDYQETHVRLSAQLKNTSAEPLHVVFDVPAEIPDASLVWGGYFAAETSTSLTWCFQTAQTVLASGTLSLDNRWSKAGGRTHQTAKEPTFLTFKIPPNSCIDFWGLSAGLPAAAIGKYKIDLEYVLTPKSNLTPESFYLQHEIAINLDFSEKSELTTVQTGREIVLKKCSYCSRLLPLDPQRLGALAFHKHNDKRTRHQNECLSCKKWKINDDLNPTRSTDQLHESSVITRERKLFLREPERLKAFNDRYKDTGLRSYIWHRFKKKCFFCKEDVELNEFQLDHTRPMAYLWPIDEYATCLCASHNNMKKDKFPVDFYNSEQLKELSLITELDIEKLKAKEVNQEELTRILADIVGFARAWEPRTFFATARKIRELSPEIDLEKLLQVENSELYSRLLFEYNPREDPEAALADLDESDDGEVPPAVEG
jgi:hypothetical protein